MGIVEVAGVIAAVEGELNAGSTPSRSAGNRACSGLDFGGDGGVIARPEPHSNSGCVASLHDVVSTAYGVEVVAVAVRLRECHATALVVVRGGIAVGASYGAAYILINTQCHRIVGKKLTRAGFA